MRGQPGNGRGLPCTGSSRADQMERGQGTKGLKNPQLPVFSVRLVLEGTQFLPK